MELRERYDPEDIESLLSERAFDELLADERAFVLRHVSGREEYEQMRALLHYVRPEERNRESIEADEAVKRNVMEIFRKQQQPHWRIWLNSVAAWLAPQEASAFWRPALAFGTLALLIVGGFVAVRQFDNANGSELAEVRTVPAKPERTAPSGSSKAESAAEDTTPQVESGSTVQRSTEENEMADKESKGNFDRSELAKVPVQEDVFVPDAALASKSETQREEAAEKYLDMVPMPTDQFTSTVTTGSATMSPTAPQTTVSHVVTADEMLRNQSLANEQGVVALEVASRKRSASAKEKDMRDVSVNSRSLAQDQVLLGLVAAGW